MTKQPLLLVYSRCLATPGGDVWSGHVTADTERQSFLQSRVMETKTAVQVRRHGETHLFGN